MGQTFPPSLFDLSPRSTPVASRRLVEAGFARRRGFAAGKSAPFDALGSSFGNSRVLAAMKYSKQANVLVSGDQDLLEIADKVQIDILSPRGFWESLR